jgi:hypothetical protein
VSESVKTKEGIGWALDGKLTSVSCMFAQDGGIKSLMGHFRRLSKHERQLDNGPRGILF